jgi:Tfp pilus assembly protein PilF
MPYCGRSTLADVIRRLREGGAPRREGRELVAALGPAPEGSGADGPSRPRAALARLSFERAAAWVARCLADGLAHAHERGVLHRDLKPANVLMADDGTPMLVDFNLADEGSAPAGGTPAYMAPEQRAALAGEAADVDGRADVYSLGLVIRELLTGEATRAAPGPPRCSRALGSIVGKCLEADPARRYATARALEEDLARELADLPLRHAADPSPRERLAKWARRHPRLSSGGALAAAAGVVIAALIGLYAARGTRLARAEAAEGLRRVASARDEARLLLGVPDPAAEDLTRARAVAEAALARFGAADGADPARAAAARPLGPAERDRLRADAAELHYLLARAARLEAERAADAAARGRTLEDGLRRNALAGAAWGGLGEPAARRQRALLLRLAGRDAEAEALERAAEAAAPATARDRLLLALARLDADDPAGALELLDAAIEAGSREPAAWLARGVCQARLGAHPRAEASFTALLALRPGEAWARQLRGATYVALGEPALAIADLDAALALRPDLTPALVNRGLARFQAGDAAGALADLDRALERPDAPTRIYLVRSRVRAAAGDEEGARRDREEGLRRTPTDEASWVARGVARLEGDDAAGALADFDAALRVDPTSRDALQNAAHALGERLGRTREAAARLDRAVALHPRYAPAWAGRAVLRARLGERPGAHADIARALELEPTPEVRYQAACVYALTSRAEPGDRAESLGWLESAFEDGYGREEAGADPDLEAIRDEIGRRASDE